MSLNWDASKTKAYKGKTKEERAAWDDACDYSPEEGYTNWQLLEALIWRSLVLGWGWALTEKNVETAIVRNDIYQRIERNGTATIPSRFIIDMIGLETNVSAETDAAWWKARRDVMTRDAKRRAQAALEQAKAEVKA